MRIRSSRRLVPALAAAAILLGPAGAPAPAQTPASIHWKLKAGEKLRFKIDQKVASKMEMMGQEMETEMSQIIDITWNVKAVDDKGTFTLDQTIARIRLNMDAGMTAFEFDSASDEEPDGMAAIVAGPLKKIAGATVTLKMDRYGKILAATVPKAFDAMMNDASMSQIAGRFSKDAVKRMVTQGLAFPPEGVSPGRKWDHKATIKTPFATVVNHTRFEYQGTEARGGRVLARIAMLPRMEMEAADDSPMPVDVKEMEGKGTAWFDPAAGRLVEVVTHSTMTMEMEMMGNTVEQHVKQTTKMTLVEGDAKAAATRPAGEKPAQKPPAGKKPGGER